MRLILVAPESRGRRESRVPNAPVASYAMKKAYELVHYRFAEHPAFPARLVLTVSFVLSLVSRAFLPPSPVQHASVVTGLISASGYQDHTTSPSAFALLVRQRHRVHRIP